MMIALFNHLLFQECNKQAEKRLKTEVRRTLYSDVGFEKQGIEFITIREHIYPKQDAVVSQSGCSVLDFFSRKFIGSAVVLYFHLLLTLN